MLIVDLNNFARYPTLAIAYLVAPLRTAGFHVDVLSPLLIGAPAATHEIPETKVEHFKRHINFSTHPVMQLLHEPLRKLYQTWQTRPHQPTLTAVSEYLSQHKPNLILLSAYLNHYPAVKALGELAAGQGIPVLLGGPAFSQPETLQAWVNLTGISAIFAGEADAVIVDLANTLIAKQDLKRFEGVYTAHWQTKVAEPLSDLSQLPLPDFSDFPWDAYPHRIIPIMTGRGCAWNVCTFCSDVTTSNGRSFRSRPVEKVLEELKVQSERYQSRDFIFLDLKLNSNLALWYALIENFQRCVPEGRWIATVHVDGQGENGLDLISLKHAKTAGLTRISFGLESGSQRLIKRMGKGTERERNSQFVRDAFQAGLSVRCSMMLGYPGETEADLQATKSFLLEHLNELDRIRPARFKAIPGTRFARLYEHRPARFKGLSVVQWDYQYARAHYHYPAASSSHYRRVKREILDLIHTINSKPLRDEARQFDGLM